MKNKYEIKDNYAIIFIKRRNGDKFETIIDVEDLDRLLRLNLTWHVAYYESSKNWYVCSTASKETKSKTKTIMLHRFLLDVEITKIRIDHINYNSLDNRKENLIETDNASNLKKRSRINRNNISGYRNVCWIQNKWRVQLQINGKNHLFLEKFESVDDAGEFAKQMRKKILW